MSKEEKQAIEKVSYIKSILAVSLDNEGSEAIETVLNLLEKNQTRIQDLEKALIDEDYKHKQEIERLKTSRDYWKTTYYQQKKEIEKKEKIIKDAIGWIKDLHDILIREFEVWPTEFSLYGNKVRESEIKEYLKNKLTSN